MINLNLICFLFVFIMVAGSCRDSSNYSASGIYIVDSSLRKEIDKNLQGIEKAMLMDIKFYKNDRQTEISDSMRHEFEQCLTHATVNDGKANIYFLAGINSGFIGQITLFKDSCIVVYHPKSNKEIYKLNQGDPLATHVAVPCKAYKVALIEQPTFRANEIFEGFFELTSKEYYEVVDGKESRYKVQLAGYFKASPNLMELYIPKGEN